jgi:hypothetical protein
MKSSVIGGVVVGDGGAWKDYVPNLDVASAPGFPGGTAPVLGTGGTPYQFGRYLYVPSQRLCIFQFIFQFGNTGNKAGTFTNLFNGNYVVSLPVAMKDGVSADPDRAVGNGRISLGSAGVGLFDNVPILWTLSDEPGDDYPGTTKNQWIQGFVPYSIAQGTGTLTTTSVTVPFGFTLPNVPAASEIEIMFTSNWNGAGASETWWISSVTATGFTLIADAAPTTAATFSWKLRTDKVTRLNGGAPFNVGATPGDAIQGTVTYETAT